MYNRDCSPEDIDVEGFSGSATKHLDLLKQMSEKEEGKRGRERKKGEEQRNRRKKSHQRGEEERKS